MSSIPFGVAAPLAGGELCSGMTLVLTIQMMWKHGLNVGVQHDKKRQILLNLICFICAINTTISYGFNATKASVTVSDVTTIITFLSVQYSLVILNHNTIIRAANIVTDGHISRERLDRYCTILYVLPPVALVPVYFAFMDTAGTGLPMNTSKWNSTIFKPLNIALIMVTAVLATVTDIMLLNKVDAHFQTFQNQGPSENREMHQAPSNNFKLKEQFRERRKKIALRKDLWTNYAITWSLLIADVVLKAVIAAGVPLLFDSILTILTVTMRSRCNLQFGLEMQKAFQKGSTNGTSNGDPTIATNNNTIVGSQPGGLPTTSGVYPTFPISKVSHPVSKAAQPFSRHW